LRDRFWHRGAKATGAKILFVALTIATVFVVAEIKVTREPAEDTRAINALRAVASAQRAYAELNGGYATSLNSLAGPCSGRHITPNLSSDPGMVRSYEVRLQADAHDPTHVDCHGKPTARAYYATAVSLHRTGIAKRAFAVDQNNTIWYDTTGAAPKPPFSETAVLKPLR
jgi:hypothetical protein